MKVQEPLSVLACEGMSSDSASGLIQSIETPTGDVTEIQRSSVGGGGSTPQRSTISPSPHATEDCEVVGV